MDNSRFKFNLDGLPLLGLLLGCVAIFVRYTAQDIQLSVICLVAALILLLFSQRQWYAYGIMTIFIFMPLCKRLVDWQLGFGAISVLSIVPLAALILPMLALAGGSWRKVPPALLGLGWIWTVTFSYGLAVGLVNQQGAAALYSFALFFLPMAFGLWLARRDENLYEQLADFLLLLGSVVSSYGIYQYIAPPAWDVNWVFASEMVGSLGQPEPFEMRVFSVLNTQATCGAFLAIVVLLNLPRLRLEAPWKLFQMGLCLITLGLTFGRSAWLGLMVGLIVYCLFNAKRMNLLVSGLALAGVCIVGFTYLPALLGSERVMERLQIRLESLTDLEGDQSTGDRQQAINPILQEIQANPLGLGLGLVGTSAKLGTTGETRPFDNGLLARLYEMGYLGTLGFALTLLTAVGLTLKCWWSTILLTERDQIAAILAIQACLMMLTFSDDYHQGLTGVLFWMCLGLLPLSPSQPES